MLKEFHIHDVPTQIAGPASIYDAAARITSRPPLAIHHWHIGK